MYESRSSTSVLAPAHTAVAHDVRNVFVSRQPIYDLQLKVFAYTVLFYSHETPQADSAEGYLSTSQMLSNTFMEIGLEAVVGQRRALFRLTRGFILLDYASVFPVDRVVLEVAPDTPLDADLLDALRGLSAQGYTIALPDVHVHEHLRPLVEIADIVKINLHACPHALVQARAAHLRHYNVKLLAEQVDTRGDFAYCRELGFDYVQGYFICQPDVVKNHRSPTNHLAVLQLLATLLDPQTEFHELEAIISRDVSLSYKLLRLINSSFFSLSRNITCIRQALLLLGLRQITTWVSLMVLTGINDKPHELTITAMVRAKMCQLLAEATAQNAPHTFFLVGLFSVLDALMDRPMPEVLEALPLADDVVQALLHHQGALGVTLRSVLAYERGDWDAVDCLSLERRAITEAYLCAIAWTAEHNATL